MERSLITKLVAWKDRKRRKPLILEGARQVGKTWLLTKFGAEYFEDVAYFSFENNLSLTDFFEDSISPTRLINSLSLLRGKKIVCGETLIIFDEIQESNRALSSLKYFCEEMPEQHIVCAGSLLGVTLSSPSSFPVGKVHFERLYPMNFTEFLRANNKKMLADYITDKSDLTPIPTPIFKELERYLTYYFVTGGMPAVVASWIEEHDIDAVDRELHNIIRSYELDFSKHPPFSDIPKIQQIWGSIPSQLAKENRKFRYNKVKSGARAREYENALTWLENAGFILKVHAVTTGLIPLTAYKDSSMFKIFLLDIGLLRILSRLSAAMILNGDSGYSLFGGALAENFIAGELLTLTGEVPYYWRSKATAEIDFIVQRNDVAVPIEVKSGKNVYSQSLQVYREKYKPKRPLRFSMRNITHDAGLTNLPLFFVQSKLW